MSYDVDQMNASALHPKTIVVVPTYNERENLEAIVCGIREQAPSVEILIVDDNSPDGTGELAVELSARHPGAIHVLRRARKEGLGRAYAAAFRQVLDLGYEIIIHMDADLSHDPRYLPAFLEAIRDCDLVLGSRYLHGINVVGWDFKRLVLSKLATRYVQMVSGMKFSDATSGFKCWRREALEAIGIESLFANGYLVLIEMTYRAYRKHLKIAEIPIIFYERDKGRSKIDVGVILEAIWGVLKLRLVR